MKAYLPDPTDPCEPHPLIADDRCVGWAMGAYRATRAQRFLKSAIQMQSFGLDWSELIQPVGSLALDRGQRFRTLAEMEPWVVLSERPWRPL